MNVEWDGTGLPPDLQDALAEEFHAERLRYGASRIVMIAGGRAFKFARGEYGRRCNLGEKKIWDICQMHEKRRRHLCPVLDVSADGSVLIMPAVGPVPAGWDSKELGDWWDYRPPGPRYPAEAKRDDFGLLEDQIVCIDYAALVLLSTEMSQT